MSDATNNTIVKAVKANRMVFYDDWTIDEKSPALGRAFLF